MCRTKYGKRPAGKARSKWVRCRPFRQGVLFFCVPFSVNPYAVFALPLGARTVYHSFSANLQTLPRKCHSSNRRWEGRGKGTIKGDYRGFKGDRV